MASAARRRAATCLLTAAHVGHDARLAVERSRVEDLAHADAHHVGEVTVVHEARADHVQLPVHPLLVLARVAKDVSRRAVRRLAEEVKHRPVGEAHAKGRAALDDEEAGLIELQQPGARRVGPPPLRGGEGVEANGSEAWARGEL